MTDHHRGNGRTNKEGEGKGESSVINQKISKSTRELELEDFKCANCDKRFETSSSLKNHIRARHEKKHNDCSIWDCRLQALYNFKKHKEKSYSEGTFRQQDCDLELKVDPMLNFGGECQHF